MSRLESYNTKQKDKIMNIIKSFNKEFTIKDIHNKLCDVGLTTIYRLVDKLVLDGKIKKTISKNVTYYQYLEDCNEENHFYLKCENCGSLLHIDCECIKELENHINKKHNFKLNKKQIIINGICKNCKGSD